MCVSEREEYGAKSLENVKCLLDKFSQNIDFILSSPLNSNSHSPSQFNSTDNIFGDQDCEHFDTRTKYKYKDSNTFCHSKHHSTTSTKRLPILSLGECRRKTTKPAKTDIYKSIRPKMWGNHTTCLDHLQLSQATTHTSEFPVKLDMEQQKHISIIVPCKRYATVEQFKQDTIVVLETLIAELKNGKLLTQGPKNKKFTIADEQLIFDHKIMSSFLTLGQLPTLSVVNTELESQYMQPLMNLSGDVVKKKKLDESSVDDTNNKFSKYVCRQHKLLQLHRPQPSHQSPTKKDKVLALKIGSLLGQPLCWSSDSEEVESFREKMLRVFDLKNEKQENKDFFNLHRAAIHTNIKDTFKEDTIRIKVTVPGFDAQFSRTFMCNVNETVSELVDKVIESIKLKNKLEHLVASDYCVRLNGRMEYILHDCPVKLIEYVRNCYRRSEIIGVTFIKYSVLDTQTLKQLIEQNTEKFAGKDLADILFEDLEASHPKNVISVQQLDNVFEIFISEISGASWPTLLGSKHFLELENVPFTVAISVSLEYAGGLLAPPITTKEVPKTNLVWNEWIKNSLLLSTLPKETRVCVSVIVIHPYDKSLIPIASSSFILFKFNDMLQSGKILLVLNTEATGMNLNQSTWNTNAYTQPTKIAIEMCSFMQPVVYDDENFFEEEGSFRQQVPNSEEENLLLSIINKDQLYVPTSQEKKMLWNFKYFCRHKANALPKILSVVDWCDHKCVKEVRRLLEVWCALPPEVALSLLDVKRSNTYVRGFAVLNLCKLTDDELVSYLPQLVQVLKFEPYHDSALGRFLIARGLRSRAHIGHMLFWHLHSELHNPHVSERYSLILEVYLKSCGQHRDALIKQMELSTKLNIIARNLKNVGLKNRAAALKEELNKTQLPRNFILPMNPRFEAAEVIIDKCKAMDSFTVPLWLSFKNKDDSTSEPIQVIFKAGDDLRQDIVTLQMMGIMDKLWKRHGVDLRLSLYGVVSTGQDQGFIEIVKNAKTTASIQKEAGGAKKAFSKSPLTNWLKKHNSNARQFACAVENFTYSCAGYCVAMYILGIGDRHNDNIMICKDGHMFHIDFAHWLGNMLKWKGIKRETSPFVFTEQFAHIMGGTNSENFKLFTSLAVNAYLCLRQYAHIFISLFLLKIHLVVLYCATEANKKSVQWK